MLNFTNILSCQTHCIRLGLERKAIGLGQVTKWTLMASGCVNVDLLGSNKCACEK